MSFLPILLSKIKLHHVSELGVTFWVGWVCPSVPPLVLFLPKVRRRWSMLSMALLARRRSKNKNIDILTYKHGLLSIDMKTKVIQHVESE